MTSLRQIEANRRNSKKSTGPKTDEGKKRSRRNAIRHGLCAETVIEILEDVEDYKAFEAAIIADYDAQTAVERELVLRLASLLWRIRRATSIETDLLRIQAEILRDHQRDAEPACPPEGSSNVLLLNTTIPLPRRAAGNAECYVPEAEGTASLFGGSAPFPTTSRDAHRDLSHAFQRLMNLDSGVFERLNRYEAALWRQTVQTLFALRLVRRRFHQIRNEWDRI